MKNQDEIDTIIYTLMPALPENREPIRFHT